MIRPCACVATVSRTDSRRRFDGAMWPPIEPISALMTLRVIRMIDTSWGREEYTGAAIQAAALPFQHTVNMNLSGRTCVDAGQVEGRTRKNHSTLDACRVKGERDAAFDSCFIVDASAQQEQCPRG